MADGGDHYVYSGALAPTSWRLATVIPLSDITSVSTGLQNRMLAVALLVTVTAFLISIGLSRSFTKRIGQLERSMRQEEGDVSVHLAPGSNDGLGQLIGHFNHMVSQLDQLMEEKVNYGVGMDQETVRDNFKPAPDGAASISGGYGIRNIHERLCLFYGPGYGLSCDSAPGRGTTVTIHIPAVKGP